MVRSVVRIHPELCPEPAGGAGFCVPGVKRSRDVERNVEHPGSTGPVVRWLIGPEPPLRPEDPPEVHESLRAPTPERLLPAQVEPRWKLWTRKELRRPSAWQG